MTHSLSFSLAIPEKKRKKEREGERKARYALSGYIWAMLCGHKTRRSILLYRVGIDHAVEGRKSAV